MTVLVLLFLLTLFVAYANGANDNFKGVATLYGANCASYRKAIVIATLGTIAGCGASIFMAETLVQAFSGKGLVPAEIAASPIFLLAVATGAGATVLLATVLGFPISTTHGLTGALVGAGFVAAGDRLDLGALGYAFVLPLLTSPAISMLLTAPAYKFGRVVSDRLGIVKESCLCVAPGQFAPVAQTLRVPTNSRCDAADVVAIGPPLPAIDVTAGRAPVCVEKYSGVVLGVTAQKLIDVAHYASAIAVSFARGLNDTPKIVGLMLAVTTLDLQVGMAAIAAAMAVGGLINARRVAETMSKKISAMNDGQALAANLVTAFMVIFASRFGMPVSTTHVSVGAIAGIGVVNRTANAGVVKSILTSWLLTLPIAAAIAGAAHLAYKVVL